ncbi:nucleic acid dioxygenase ALKBH1 [Octodon degus]|uniref:Nucleic acid dioxygenase ALKBH1 n=1 Tax=Octodon degus TaxID=10160 RepID=A0A6P6DAI9_OCTDE|nr:nucleic acid dioxygenase ALKBH1 [Octodon degus]
MGKMAAALTSVATLATEPGEDAFRKLFRFYRQSRPGTADLGGVIDFSAAQAGHSTGPATQKVVRSQLSVSSVSEHNAHRAGLKPVSKWQAYGLEGYPVFCSYIPTKPWLITCTKFRLKGPYKGLLPPLKLIISSFIANLCRCKELNKRRPRSLLEKLRWVTLGYHYNWDTQSREWQDLGMNNAGFTLADAHPRVRKISKRLLLTAVGISLLSTDRQWHRGQVGSKCQTHAKQYSVIRLPDSRETEA